MQNIALPETPGKRGTASHSMLEAALAYASRGWRVLPVHTPTGAMCSCGKRCANLGKHPRNPTGLSGATTDTSQIRNWWEQWPDANVGIATGPESGICVIDVDGTVGQASLRALGAAHTLPQTLMALSGRVGVNGERTGFHLYFRHPSGLGPRTNVGRFGRGIDVRAARAYIVAPPSLHASGLRYRWEDTAALISELPAIFLEGVTGPQRSRELVPHAGLLMEGTRNDGLFRFACACRRRGDTKAAIYQKLMEENERRCRPALGADELGSIAANAADYAAGGPDPLESAWRKVQTETHESRESRLWSLACHLQRARPNFPIALPQVRVAALLQCDHTLVSRYTKRFVADGRLTLEKAYVARRMAAQYRVSL